jgi:hypothetical protein
MGAAQGEADSDFYYLIPSILSLIANIFVIVYCFIVGDLNKQFYQFAVMFALLDSISCISGILTPLHKTNNTICVTQQYLFQFSNLGKAFMCVIVVAAFDFAIRYGQSRTSYDWKSALFRLWFVFPFILIIISIALDTAKVCHDIYFYFLVSTYNGFICSECFHRYFVHSMRMEKYTIKNMKRTRNILLQLLRIISS